MQNLKKCFLFTLTILWCFSFSLAQDTTQENTTGTLITPVLEPALPTPTVTEQLADSGPQIEQSNRSFLPQGLSNIFQQKPKQPQQVAATTQQETATNTQQQNQQQAQTTNHANLKEGIQSGNLAYDFRLLNMQGQTVQLSSLRGRPVLLNFWGINCPPCIEELPILQKADREINGQFRGLTSSANAHFILVALRSNSDETKEFLDSLDINMHTLIEATLDQQSNLPYTVDDTESVFRDYRAFGLPTTFLIDHTGVIQSKRIGAFVNEAELSHYLNSVNINWQPIQ